MIKLKTFEEIEAKIEKLPEHAKPELNDLIEFLLSKYGENVTQVAPFTFDWEGRLSNLRQKYSSIELQHKAMEWR